MIGPGASPLTFADVVAAEEAQVAAGTAQACGDTCLCHGGHTCIRAAHPHDPDLRRHDGTLGDVAPHAARQADGTLVQWTCTDPAARAATADQHAATASQARADHTAAVLAGLDLDTLREALAGKG